MVNRESMEWNNYWCSGFFTAICIYRYLYYGLINHESRKVELLEYVRLYNGNSEWDSQWNIPTKESHSDKSEIDMPPFYLTTQQNVIIFDKETGNYWRSLSSHERPTDLVKQKSPFK